MLGYCKRRADHGFSYLLSMNLSLTCFAVLKVGRHIDVT